MKRLWMLLTVMLLAVYAAPCALAKSYGLNDRADEIAQIQTALEELDFYYADITGKYGTRTQAAVKKFQKRYGLAQTGTANEETIALLYEKAGMQALATDTASDGVYGSETLREGAKSDAVRILQENLTLLEYYSGSITGSYGRLTKEAVRKFQRDNELSADGVAGPRTFKKLAQLLTGDQAQETPVITLPGASADSAIGNNKDSLDDVALLNTEWTLRRTSRSGYVTRLQKALSALGYDPGSADGKFGEKTENAVKLYQSVRGLTSDGVAGRATLRQINEDIQNGVTLENAGVD
ncbi:MAG: peptidoglycan-binding protein [Clostridia bacterium]|nr:peptidoglycan-binding protein [Clostridia bacterium]